MIASTVRSGYALGWAIGPVLGTLSAAALGYRVSLALTGVLVLLPLIPPRRLRDGTARTDGEGPASRPHPAPTDHPDRRRPDRSNGSRSLWLFAAVCLLALTGEALRLTYLPVLAVDRLGVPLWLFGVLISAAPVVELVAMPAAGALADRFGLRVVIFCGLLIDSRVRRLRVQLRGARPPPWTTPQRLLRRGAPRPRRDVRPTAPSGRRGLCRVSVLCRSDPLSGSGRPFGEHVRRPYGTGNPVFHPRRALLGCRRAAAVDAGRGRPTLANTQLGSGFTGRRQR